MFVSQVFHVLKQILLSRYSKAWLRLSFQNRVNRCYGYIYHLGLNYTSIPLSQKKSERNRALTILGDVFEKSKTQMAL